MNKDVIMVICILLAIVGGSVAVVAFEKQRKLNKSLEEERYSRMVAEESLQKSAGKLATLENQLKTADERVAKIKDVLEQEKDINVELKNQYERLEHSKMELEFRLQAALREKAVVQQMQDMIMPSQQSLMDGNAAGSTVSAGAQ